MTLSMNDISLVHWFPQREQHRCGYCKSENGSVSYGMWAETMTVKDYQNLIDRGWRRSGKYCYKPTMNETCCPQYTIRCDALNFKLSNSHKKIIKKFNRFINEDVLNRTEGVTNAEESNYEMFHRERPNISFDYPNVNIELQDDGERNGPIASSSGATIPSTSSTSTESASEVANKKVKVTDDAQIPSSEKVKKGVGADPNKPPCKKAKVLRLERKRQKMLEKGLNFTKTNQNETKSLRQFLNEISSDSRHKLKIRFVCTSQNESFFDLDVEHELYKKYQMIIHNDPPQKCTRKAFSRFLVHTPLKAEIWDDDDLGYGSFHQQYWLDDKLIAVGVIDILPKCISSVYFFYDPDYSSLTLGTYGSLREIDFTSKLNQTKPDIKYYYMGYYIHSCPKMRYKGKLSPSDLLCPETYKWFPISNCIPKLEISKYSRLNDDTQAIDEEACTSRDINRIKIILYNRYILFEKYENRENERPIFQNIGKLIGNKCIETMLFVNQ